MALLPNNTINAAKPIGSEVQVEKLPGLNTFSGETQSAWNARTRTITYTNDSGVKTTTTALAFNASAATIATAVAALVGGSGNISVAGGNGIYTYSFGGTLANKGIRPLYSTDTGTGIRNYFDTVVRGFSAEAQTIYKQGLTTDATNSAGLGGGSFKGFNVQTPYDIGNASRYTQNSTIMKETFVPTGLPTSVIVPTLTVGTGSLTGGGSVIATTTPGTYGVREVRQETVTATGGTRTLTFGGQTTAPIAFDANAAAIQSALVALSNVAAGDIVVTGTGPFVYTFNQVYDTRSTRTITFSGQTTTALAFDADAATVQTALEALSNVAPGDILVTRAGDVLTYTYAGALIGVQPHLRTHSANLKGYKSSMIVAQEGSPYKVARPE